MKCGIGIRPELFSPVFEQLPDFGFLEAHSENYFGESIARTKLLEIREKYPVSLHGVGLSLGRADHLDKNHLKQLKELINDIDPLFVSEHLAWSAYSHRHAPDLLPLPLTDQAFNVMCDHVDQMQNLLGRSILVENPSNYLVFDQLQIPEPEFLNSLAKKTGCGLLVDVNNIHVSATNVGRDALAYVDELDSSAIAQYHLAGYTEVNRKVSGVEETVLIDTHNNTVFDPVWSLYEHVLSKHGGRPTLFEWDSDFPEFETILNECEKANQRLSSASFEKVSLQPKPANVGSNKQDLVESQAKFLDSVFDLEKALAGVEKDQQHRIWIYQNNVFGAIQEYLQEVYPATQGVVGEAFFKQMAQRFIQQTPPEEGNIHLYGVGFEAILAEFKELKNMPYLKPLIELEWSVHESYFSKVSDCLDPTEVAQEELLTMPVELNDSVAITSSLFPLHDIYTQSLPSYKGKVAIDLNSGGQATLVYKLHHLVNNTLLTDSSLKFIEQINKSENLLQVIETLSGSIEPEELSSVLAFVFENKLLKPKIH